MLDVAQGDSLLLDLPDGEAMLIDGGGLVGSPIDTGTRVVGPVLRARRRSELAAVVLSHPHPDHYGGLLTGTDGVAIGSFWDTGQSEEDRGPSAASDKPTASVSTAARGVVEAMRARGVLIRRPHELCGHHEMHGVAIDVLAPCPGYDPDRGANDNSFVLRVSFGRRAFLFVGDAEHEAEAGLLARYAPRIHPEFELRADVLKVGHHGSATSTSPAFLEAVQPNVALVSTGIRNRFNHPRRETLAALQAARVATFRTDRDGAIEVETDGESLEVRTARRGLLYTGTHR